MRKTFLMVSMLLTLSAVAFAQKSQLRVAHLSPDAPAVDIWLDGTRVLENVPFKAVSNYLEINSGSRRIQVSPAGATTPIVIDATVTFDANKAYTVAATGLTATNDLKPIVLVDDRTADPAKAKIRFVHTSPDAPAVDIAVKNGPVLFSNVKFREAGNYLSVAPASYDLEVRLAGTATVALNVPGVVLAANTNYTVFAVGRVSNATLAALPAVDQGTTQVRVGHLSPDAPAVDVWVNGNRTLQNVSYKTISAYLSLPAGQYRIQVSPAGATTPIVIDATVTFDANKAYTVVATGLIGANDLKPLVLVDDLVTDAQKAKLRFVHTSPDAPAVDIAVKNGPVLFSNVKFREAGAYLSVGPSLYDIEVRLAGTTTVAFTVPKVVLAAAVNYSVFAIGQAGKSTLAALPVVDAGTLPQNAQVRVAHLSPDAPAVDVWLNGHRILLNVPFKTISDYLDLPAGQYRIQVSPAGATTPIVIDATLMIEANKAYTVAATGLLGTNDLKPLVLADDRNADNKKAKVRFIHTSPDAPAVDIAVKGGPVLFSNVKFREAGNYLSVNPASYDLEVRLAGTNTVALSVNGVALSAGTNYSVFAVGRVSNSTLSALSAVDVKVPVVNTQIRVAHLSPDAPNVDVWVDGNRVLTNVPFKAISDYLTVPAGSYRIQVSPAGASTPIVIDANVTFDGNKAYTVAATGLLGSNDLKPIVLVDDRSPDPAKAKIRFVHTSPDAPAVDIAVKNGPVLFSNIKFREAGNYLAVNPASYDLEVRLAGTTTVALNVAAVQVNAARNYVVFAVGLAGNSTLSALLRTEVLTSINDQNSSSVLPADFELSQNYPNPFNPETKIAFTLPTNTRVKLVVYDLLGKEVVRLAEGNFQPGQYTIRWDGRDSRGVQVATGAYIYRLQSADVNMTRTMLYLR